MKFKYISDFLKRDGLSVLISTALVKICAAVLSIIVVNMMTTVEYGILSYVLSIYSIAIVIAGFGGNYSLLRYGAIAKSYIKKLFYFKYTLRVGTLLCLIISLLIIIYSFFPIGIKNSMIAVIVSSIIIVPYYRLETLRSYYRILDLNKIYSKLNICNSILIIIFAVIGTYFYGIIGYLFGLGIAHFLAFVFFDKSKIKVGYTTIDIAKKEYWGYGLHTSISAIANQIVFSIAPLLLGILLAPESEIAHFKVATIIPFNLLTLPGILMITDFNYLAKNYDNKAIIREYYLNYLKTIIPLSTIVFVFLIVFAYDIIPFLFGDEYVDCINMYICFMIATFVTYIFRNPLGNILLAVGKAKWNGYNAYFFCVFYVVFTLVFYDMWGVYSAVYGLCITFILSGFVSLFMYMHYLKQLR